MFIGDSPPSAPPDHLPRRVSWCAKTEDPLNPFLTQTPLQRRACVDGRCVAGFTPCRASERESGGSFGRRQDRPSRQLTLCGPGSRTPSGVNGPEPTAPVEGRLRAVSSTFDSPCFHGGRRAGLEALDAAPPTCEGEGCPEGLVRCLSWSSWTRARPSAACPGEFSQEPSGSRATSWRTGGWFEIHVSTWGSERLTVLLERREPLVESDARRTARS